MRIVKQWSGLNKPVKSEKERCFETDKGFLIRWITDETPEAEFQRFKAAMLPYAAVYDACDTQEKVWKLEKLTNQLQREAGLKDT